MANLYDIYNTFKGGFPGVNKKLVYPLENQSDYLGKITFTPIVEDPVDMKENLETLSTVIRENIIEFGKLITDPFSAEASTVNDPGQTGQAASGAEKGRGGSAPTTETARIGQAEAANARNAFYGGAPKSAPPFSEESLNLNTDNRISLYLPRAIQIQDTVSYDNQFQLGLIGGAIEAGLQPGGGGGLGAALGAIGNEVSGITNTVLGRTGGMSSEAAGILSGKIAAKVPFVGDQAAGAVRSATGLTTNPNVRAIFKDVPIRNFSFAFQLIPTSQNEALVIEDIIKTFRTELYPTALRAGGVNIGYRFPNRFLIKVRYNHNDIAGIKFLPVYLQSFNAVYNSATGGMHSDGRFSAVDISMAFTETRALHKEDVEKGGY